MKYYEIENLYCENISCDDLIDVLNTSKDIIEYYGIVHDKDIKEDTGEFKKSHFHLYIAFEDYGRYTIDKVKEFFKPLSNRINSIKSFKKSIQYLIHFNDKNKYQYDLNDVFTNNKDKLLKQFEEKEKEINDVLNDFIDKIYNFEIFNSLQVISYFKSINKMNYCVSHYRYLCEILDNIINSFECQRNEERSDVDCS